ncbi:MAG: cyclic nucleotide-binding domain-containing protein [Mariprofundaceae bacterium]|nr:cyclic nucleotide-binding domain-containing protein [Mariprofundaceae bacterium]
MNLDISWLEQHLFLRELTEEERKVLPCIKVQTFKNGEPIIEQGQPGGTLYILRSGEALVEDINEDMRIRIAGVCEGTLLGEITFLNSHVTTAQVTANQDCIVYTLSKEEFSLIMHDQQTLAYDILSKMLSSQAEIIQRMNTQLLPIWRNIKKKANSLPLFVKIFPLLFIAAYTAAFFNVSLR